jgi:hypothetical protein
LTGFLWGLTGFDELSEMKLFMATRWGNPYEADGPNGEDTNCLVRASCLEDVARLAEELLMCWPQSVGENRPVESHIHCIRLIGEDTTSELPSVIHGPWIAVSVVRDSNFNMWIRDETDGEWIDASEEAQT